MLSLINFDISCIV